jgi:hypothetical protein
MKKKCTILSLCSFAIALAIYAFTYFLYHYLSPSGTFTPVFQETPAKPFVTLLFGIWGVTFHFASVMSLLIGKIFFSKENGS